MHTNLVKQERFESSFLSSEKDTETILKKLFIESQPHSNILKRLLVIQAKDCLTNLEQPDYKKKLAEMSLAKLMQEGYVKLAPKIRIPEHEQIKTYLILSYDNFTETSNPHYRDCTIHFDIICHTDYWQMDNYQIRPLKIAGFIDGILNNAKLSGIGTLQFVSCNETVLDETLSGYCLTYLATHGNDDLIEPEE